MAEAITAVPEKVSFKTKINYALGSFGNAFLYGFVTANIQFYYVDRLGASIESLMTAWLIFAIWNTINDPIVSWIEDNTRTRIGRRIPYIRYGSFLFGFSFLFCWFPIAKPGDTVGLFWNFLAILFLLDTVYSFVGCCYYSLPNEIAVTAKERAKLSVFSALVGLVNLALGLVLPAMLLTGEEGVSPYFKPIMIFMAIFCSLLLFFSSFGIKENMFAQMQPHEKFFKGIILTFKNKPFWIFAIPLFIGSIITPIFSTGLVYYIQYVLNGPTIIGIIITFILGILVGLIFWPIIVARLYPKKSLMLTLGIICIVMTIVFFVGKIPYAPIIPFLFVGFGFIGVSITGSVVNGDVIDNDELITGKRREAIYGGVNALVTKPGLSIANWLFGAIILLFKFKIPVITEEGEVITQLQPDSAKTGILFAFSITMAIGVLICFFAMFLFPLDGPEWRKKKEGIFELHVQKEREYIQSLQNSQET